MKDRNIAERQRPSRTRKPRISGKAGIKEIPESERSYRTQLSVLMASPFMFAIEHGDLKTVRALLDSGVTGLSVRDPNGNEPLHAAAEQKDPEVVQFLIKHGAYLETKNDQGQTPLHLACQHGHTEVAKLFMDLGLDVCLNDKNADTPLHTACFHGRPAIVRLLLEKGAEVNVQDRGGYTPLHAACAHGRTAIIRLLLEKGAEVGIKDAIDDTALDKILRFPPDDTAREEILDLFRQYAPEAVMEAYCTKGPGEQP